MESITKKIKPYIQFGGWIVAGITIIWSAFGYYYKFEENMKVIQKASLRNTIWNVNIPLHDRLESCDSYLELGYNSETKKYCNQLLDKVGDL